MKLHLALLAVTMAAAPAGAATLFSDTFQGPLGAQWAGGSGGVIVAAPGGGNALAFTRTIGGGDLFAAAPVMASNGQYKLSFEYLGTCERGQSCGGFVGINYVTGGEQWLAGSGPYPSLSPITETGAWQQINVNFSSAVPVILKLEDWNGGTDGGAPLNAYFRNLTLSGAVPEPSSWAMLIAGFGLTGATMRRRRVAIAA